MALKGGRGKQLTCASTVKRGKEKSSLQTAYQSTFQIHTKTVKAIGAKWNKTLGWIYPCVHLAMLHLMDYKNQVKLYINRILIKCGSWEVNNCTAIKEDSKKYF